MIVFADTSAFIKLYIDEPGSDPMKSFVRGKVVAVSPLAFAEAHATFARCLRERRIKRPEYGLLTRRFREEWRATHRVCMTDSVLDLVPNLCGGHPLRGADAAHLASALFLCGQHLEVIFACSDIRLIDAARKEGLKTFDPAVDTKAPVV